MRKIVIGGGASGLMAAYFAAKSGHDVILLEKNEKFGKKLYITGKGRCNLTNDCPPGEFLEHVVRGAKFLHGAIFRFPPAETMKFFEEHGLSLKVERGNRVFPASDKASDVTKTLERACREAGAELRCGCEVTKIDIQDGVARGVFLQREHIPADRVIVATGGLTYPSTGSTGDGYRFAREAGLRVEPQTPALVGLETQDDLSAAQGITLKNVVLTAKFGGKTLFSHLGEVLFTHYGVSGPLILTLSSVASKLSPEEMTVALDLKPALDEKKLSSRLVSDLSQRCNEQMKSVLRGALPAGLVLLVLKRAEIPPEKRANAVTREERERLVRTIKNFPVRGRVWRGFSEAVITVGGVSLFELDPRTMESKRVRGLCFCGETVDADALTGGFNLQIAFSTGYLAGIAD